MSEPTTAQSIRLTDQQTVHDTMLMGQRYIPLHANGYSCQTADVWRIVLAAAARCTTIEAACADLARTPDANSVRGYLTAQLSQPIFPTRSGNGMRYSGRSCLSGWRPVRKPLPSISMMNRTMVTSNRTLPIRGFVAGSPRRHDPFLSLCHGLCHAA